MDKVCVVVFTCRRPDDLRRCLDSVMEQTCRDFELVVVNNGDDSETEGMLKDYDSKIINDKTRRLSRLFNLGWRNTDREVIAYLADDVELDPSWLQQGLSSLERNPLAAVITGPLVSPFEFTGQMHALYVQGNKSPFLSRLVKFYNNYIMEGKAFEPCVLCESGSYTLGQGFEPDFSEEREVDLATTSCMLFRRSAVDSIGGFDENFIFNHADGDLFIRLKKRGFKIVYNPHMKGVHYNRLGPSRSPFFIGRDTAYFYLKDIRPKSLKGFFSAIANIFVLNTYWIYNAIKTHSISQLAGIAGFIKGLFDYLSVRIICA